MVTVKLSREGKVMDRSLKVGEMDEKVDRAETPSSHKSLGIAVQDLTPEIAQGLGLKKATGVVVTQVEPGSPAAEAGLQTGDVIREVNRKPVKNADDFGRKAEKVPGSRHRSALYPARRKPSLRGRNPKVKGYLPDRGTGKDFLDRAAFPSPCPEHLLF